MLSLRLLIRQGVFYEGIIPGCSNYQYCKRMPAAQTAGEWELAWVCAMCEFMGPDRKQRNSEAGTIRLRTLDKLAAKTRQHYYVIPLLVFLSSSSCSARFCSVFTVLPIFQRLRDQKSCFYIHAFTHVSSLNSSPLVLYAYHFLWACVF